MTILWNYEDSFDTATATANKLAGIDPNAINHLIIIIIIFTQAIPP